MNYKFIKVEKNNAVGSITMNREEVLNSFNYEMAIEFQNALDAFELDNEVRAIVITGAGRAFCAGQDLQASLTGTKTIREIVAEQYNPIIIKIRSIEKPIIAAVNGVAAGAGANIALACDFVIAKENASFVQSFVNIGLVPDSAGSWILPRLVGFARANAMVMLGEKVKGTEAEQIGLIYKAVSEENFEGFVNEFAQNLSQKPTFAIGLTKRAMNYSMINNLYEQLELEENLQEQAADSYDFKEGVNAFLEKRKPVYKGE